MPKVERASIGKPSPYLIPNSPHAQAINPEITAPTMLAAIAWLAVKPLVIAVDPITQYVADIPAATLDRVD